MSRKPTTHESPLETRQYYLKQHVNHLILVDGEAICKQCGSAKVLNVALLGAACGAGLLGLLKEQLEETIHQRLPQRFVELNTKALHAGIAAAQGGTD